MAGTGTASPITTGLEASFAAARSPASSGGGWGGLDSGHRTQDTAHITHTHLQQEQYPASSKHLIQLEVAAILWLRFLRKEHPNAAIERV